MNDFRAGFVSIIGKPNVGKSTLLNRLIGDKLSIISPKPQTTRRCIRGFLNLEKAQVIFLDTPGFIEPRYELQEKMRKFLNDSLKGSDLVLFITSAPDFPSDYDEAVLKLLKSSNKTAFGILNKVDLCSKDILEEKEVYLKSHIDKVFTMSALKDDNFDDLTSSIVQNLQYSPPLYNTEDLSDMPLRFFASEIIREKIFLGFDEEIPYSSTVVIEKWIEETTRDVIQATIWVEKDSQKQIVIGKSGTKIGSIREKAEHDISQLTGKIAVLNLWVKVKHNWRKKLGALHEFGYK